MTQLQQQIQRNLSDNKTELTNHYFLLRFWSIFVQSPLAERILNEELLKTSLEYIAAGFIEINSRGGGGKDAITERDMKNGLMLLNFCIRNDFMVNTLVKDIASQLQYDYEKNGYRLRLENQEGFIKTFKKLYKNDPKK